MILLENIKVILIMIKFCAKRVKCEQTNLPIVLEQYCHLEFTKKKKTRIDNEGINILYVLLHVPYLFEFLMHPHFRPEFL